MVFRKDNFCYPLQVRTHLIKNSLLSEGNNLQMLFANVIPVAFAIATVAVVVSVFLENKYLIEGDFIITHTSGD